MPKFLSISSLIVKMKEDISIRRYWVLKTFNGKIGNRFFALLCSTALVLCFAQSTQAARARGRTLAQDISGRCHFGNSWESVLKGAQNAMAQVTHNSAVRNNISKKRIAHVACASPNSAILFSNGNTIDVRKCKSAGAQPSSYSVTMIHENCHSVGQAGLYGKFKKFNCDGVSQYARTGGYNEMFAEACTAYLVAPDRLKGSNCNPSAVKAFFKEHAFKGPIKSCSGGPSTRLANGPGGGSIDPNQLLQLAALGGIAAMAMKEDEEEEESDLPFCADPKNAQSPLCGEHVICSDPVLATKPENADKCKNFSSSNETQVTSTRADVSAQRVNDGTDERPEDTGALLAAINPTGADASNANADSVDDLFANNTASPPMNEQQKVEAYWSKFFGRTDKSFFEREEEAAPLEEANSSTEEPTGEPPAAPPPSKEPQKRNRQKRAVSNLSLFGKGGLTKASGPSLWAKINDRYSEVRHNWAKEDFRTNLKSSR